MNKNELLKKSVQVVDERGAEDIVILDMQGISLIADYFLICHGNSERQVQAIARDLKVSAEELGLEINKIEGFNEAKWILVDMGEIIAHVFHREERSYYNLERLWGDAPVVNIEKEISSDV